MLSKGDLSSIRKVVNEIVVDASHTILAGVEKMFEERDAKLDEHGRKLDEHGKRLEKIETNATFIRHDINDIKADLSLTPSKKEFSKLKEKVETLSI